MTVLDIFYDILREHGVPEKAREMITREADKKQPKGANAMRMEVPKQFEEFTRRVLETYSESFLTKLAERQ